MQLVCKEITDIPYNLYPVSPSGNIWQNYRAAAQQETDTDTVQGRAQFTSFIGIHACLLVHISFSAMLSRIQIGVTTTTTVGTQIRSMTRIPGATLWQLTSPAFLPTPQLLVTMNLLSVSVYVPFKGCYRNGIIRDVTFWENLNVQLGILPPRTKPAFPGFPRISCSYGTTFWPAGLKWKSYLGLMGSLLKARKPMRPESPPFGSSAVPPGLY